MNPDQFEEAIASFYKCGEKGFKFV